jgi:hypothetical protein
MLSCLFGNPFSYFHVMNIMGRRLCFFGFLFMFFSFSELSAQDLIVTINSDSLDVKIDKETDRFVYYIIPKQGNNSLVMSKKQISDIVYGFYSGSPAAVSSGKTGGEPDKPYASGSALVDKKMERLQLSASIGYARMLVLVDEDNQLVKDYYNKLYNGFDYSFQFNYMFKEKLGVGLMFETARFENSISASYTNPNAPPNTAPVFGQISDDITLQHFGANFIFRLPFRRSSSALQFDAGFGFSTYENIAEVVYEYELRGETLGLSVGASYQLNLGGGLYIPFRIGIKTALFTNMDLETADDMPDELASDLNNQLEESIGISGERFSLSIGLLYAF